VLRRILLAALCAAALLPCAPAGAQDRAREPRRPRLDAAADTNSAAAYYSHGVRVMESRPGEAADAFYWATRIEPGMADAWYARRIAFFMARPERFGGYMDGNRRIVESREVRAVDSLHLRALTLNPFLRTKFDKDLFDHYMHWSIRRDNPRDRIDPAEMKFWLDSWLRDGGPATRGWMAYAEGRFPDALDNYAAALRSSRDKSPIHANRARIFLLVGRPDSALTEMGRAVERMRERDAKDMVYLYESKALYEHSTGIILEQQGRPDQAREAYGRALQEDLSYYPAHVALATLAFASADTATALAELDLAVQIRGDDAGVRYAYAQALALSGRFPEAEEHLRSAVASEPWYAPPYALLGGVLEKAGKGSEAREAYATFLARSARTHPLRTNVQARLAVLGGGGGQ
jgi:tetratricopeptide (TPR) repeat protein